MNDSMSLLLASTLLAMGGVGLYLYKASNDDDSNDYEDNYVENDNEGLFDRFWKGGDDDEDDEDDDELSTISDDLSLSDDEESIEKPKKKRTNNKTKRNRKSGGSSKRKY